ncbi:MAG: YbaB/EbfC family nucleoid-associated protein [Phycisphaerales bacterium]
MFDQMKAMGALAGLLRDKERVRQIAQDFEQRLERISVTGQAGGGAVRVTVSGKMRVTDVALDPALVAGMTHGEGGQAMAQALIMDATNDALLTAQMRVKDETQKMTEELGLPEIPGLNKLLG